MEANVYRGADAHHPLLQPLRRARLLPRLPRAARMDRQDRPQDAGLEGGLGQDLRHHQHAAQIPRPSPRAGPARMGAAEGERQPGMPQLPFVGGDGPVQADGARRRRSTRATCLPGEATCIDCHKGIAHELPNMEGVDPGWKVPPELQGDQLPAASVFDRLDRIARSPHGFMWSVDLDTSSLPN